MTDMLTDGHTHQSDSVDTVSERFNSPGADLRLRSVDGVIFHVFGCILTEASSVFRDMFLVSKPEQGDGDSRSPVELSEDSETWDLILRFLYPIPNPPVTTFDALKKILKTADKYCLDGVLDSLRHILVSPKFIEKDPLRVYALACMYCLDVEAKVASRHCLTVDIIKQELHEELAFVSARDLLRLIKLHRERAEVGIHILNEATFSSCQGYGGGKPGWWKDFELRASDELRVRPLTDVIFHPSFLAKSVNTAAGDCERCATNYLSPAHQARLISLKEKIDNLKDTI